MVTDKFGDYGSAANKFSLSKEKPLPYLRKKCKQFCSIYAMDSGVYNTKKCKHIIYSNKFWSRFLPEQFYQRT